MTPELQPAEPLVLSFEPYTGVWTKAEAAHLLRRTMFGASLKDINDAVALGMDGTLAQLFIPPPFKDPITYSSDETQAAIGSTWVNSVYEADPLYMQQVIQIRLNSISIWLMERLNNRQMSIHEKMCLFWQNHFGATASIDSRAAYDYFMLIRNYSLGNFREFVKKMTVNPNMLIFLNGQTNTAESPNENYARELLELFTIGKGPQIGPGDYTNYTEKDVSAGSRILTGWSINGYRSTTITKVTSYFFAGRHDTSDKTLSSSFGGAVINNADANEYKNYIDIIFQNPETAKFICRKIYNWFVNYDLTDEVENTIILEMSNLLISNNYEIFPVVEALLKSEHFYDVNLRGTIVKNPLEVMFSMLNTTGSIPSFDLERTHKMYLSLSLITRKMGMDYKLPPSVAGWIAYYQKPFFTKNWVNASYLKLRFDLVDRLTTGGGINVEEAIFQINYLDFVNNLSNPQDSTQVIEDIATVFCPRGLSLSQKASLHTVLLDSLPEFEWTVEYNAYLADPTNTVVSEPIRRRVELVLNKVFKLPEFQTI